MPNYAVIQCASERKQNATVSLACGDGRLWLNRLLGVPTVQQSTRLPLRDATGSMVDQSENLEKVRPVQLKSLAKVIRSKNAGPCLLTLDLMLTDRAAFAYVI